MKFRRHHNNKGLRQIKTHKTEKQIEHIAQRLKILLTPPPNKK